MFEFELTVPKNVIILCFVFTQFHQPTLSFDFCELSCKGRKHTMCEYEAGGGDDCPNNEKVYLKVNEKRHILAFHNNIRESVATGKEFRGVGGKKQPSASNLMKLVWDGEAGAFAKRWADQCKGGLHDNCRRLTDSNNRVGQNSYLGTFTLDDISNSVQARRERILNAMKTWYGEVDHMNASQIHKYDHEMAKTVSNYTQIVWASTIFMGCGYTEFTHRDGTVSYRFICDYFPAGNRVGESVYKVGEPCASCPGVANCSNTWYGLCWNGGINEFIDDIPDESTPLRSSPLVIGLLYMTTIAIYLQSQYFNKLI